MPELDESGGNLGNLADPALRQALDPHLTLTEQISLLQEPTPGGGPPALLPLSSRIGGVVVVAIAEGLIFLTIRGGVHLLGRMNAHLQTLHAYSLSDLVSNLAALVVFLALLVGALVGGIILIVLGILCLGQLGPAIQGTKTPAAIAHSLISTFWLSS